MQLSSIVTRYLDEAIHANPRDIANLVADEIAEECLRDALRIAGNR